ncbi:hypothetical protein ONA24_01360 [Mycoplasmopsis cynos]|uniref:hypothetical protein n=1 Tax=Mycoplasmopsis cynos TaxID=171284 RepID=UPI0024C9F972|nr:hypothetical protein [Mycoplasmopsis cynos]WAM09961.1 hypothetical protein ONA24_01360 [Mycoplasmopsis cynos]
MLTNLKQNNKSFNPFSIYPKIRTDFLTRTDFIFGNDDSLDIFEFSKKMKWKEYVFEFLEGLKNYEK